jgi:hypothetical protein
MAEDWLGAYEELKGEVEEFRDFGSGVVLTPVVQTGRPVGSTGVVRVREGHVALVENGLVLRITTYPDIDQARAAAERLVQERG